ncbi:hypothetical protein BTA51_12890 [Hahella sp. CCB-MM4]|nr:hypothetical protein BTA51_12890 [Hahella sp. CCB-MM4]
MAAEADSGDQLYPSGSRQLHEPTEHADSLLQRAREDWLASREKGPVAKARPLQELEPPKLKFKPKLQLRIPVAEEEKTAVTTKTAALRMSTEVSSKPAVKAEVSPDIKPVETKTAVKPEQKQETPSPDTIHRHKFDAPEPQVKVERQNVVEEPVEVVEDAAEDVVAVVSQDVGTPDGEWPNERPAWAQDRFECLLFNVAGLKLAVPLVSLGGVYALDSELTPLFGMPKWFLGLFPYGDLNLKVVDTALWVMPERYSANWLDGLKYLVRLQDSEWVLACDNIAEAFTLDPEEVKWRSERSKRPWLAGTVITHMCALIDVSGFEKLLGSAASTVTQSDHK